MRASRSLRGRILVRARFYPPSRMQPVYIGSPLESKLSSKIAAGKFLRAVRSIPTERMRAGRSKCTALRGPFVPSEQIRDGVVDGAWRPWIGVDVSAGVRVEGSKHSDRNVPLKLSTNAFSVGLPGLEKSIFTPF